jgi:uncharacterized protein
MEFDLRFSGPQSAKHLIESMGIPHTEIGSVFADGKNVDPGHLVGNAETIDIFEQPPANEQDQEPRFVLDCHLGRLAAHLRMLGMDCLYENNYDDRTLLRLCLSDARVLLTRDRRLLMHKVVVVGCLLRSLDPWEQLKEVFYRYSLRAWIRPFKRCIRCNHSLATVAKAEIEYLLEPLTRRHFDDFRICPSCKQVYWKGSHYDRMLRMIEDLWQLEATCEVVGR